jgi:hypothetical protein
MIPGWMTLQRHDSHDRLLSDHYVQIELIPLTTTVTLHCYECFPSSARTPLISYRTAELVDCGSVEEVLLSINIITTEVETKHASPQGPSCESPKGKHCLYRLSRLQEALQRQLSLLQLPPQRTRPDLHTIQGRVGYRTAQPPGSRLAIGSRLGSDLGRLSRHSRHPEPDRLSRHQPIPISRSPSPRGGFPIPGGHSPDSSAHATELAR